MYISKVSFYLNLLAHGVDIVKVTKTLDIWLSDVNIVTI